MPFSTTSITSQHFPSMHWNICFGALLVFHKDLYEAMHEMKSVFKCPFCTQVRWTPSRDISWPNLELHLVRLTYGLMYALVEASSGQKWYYFRSGWPLVRCTPPVEASPGQEWYYFRSGWPLVRCTPPLEASSGHEWYNFRSGRPLVRHTPCHTPLTTPCPLTPPLQWRYCGTFGTTLGRLICGQMYPLPHPLTSACSPVETSHGKVWYYFGQADLWPDVPLHPNLPEETSHGHIWY